MKRRMAADGSAALVPPRSEIERSLCDIWAELLEMHPEEIGIYSDFFH
jgi:hypothetical protein